MGDHPARRQEEIESLRYGLAHGLRVIDTAEMYGYGRSETVIGEAIRGQRDKAFIVSKVLPAHADFPDVIRACERSLHYLDTDWIDLYLLHWRSSTPLEETIRAFLHLQQQGKIRSWGVSNFDVDDMEELEQIAPPGSAGQIHMTQAAANQILYSLEHRGTEFDLLKRDANSGIVTMAYSPIGQGKKLLRHPVLCRIAENYKTSLGLATTAQIALAWVLRKPNILAIPKSASLIHQKQNIAALEITLSDQDLMELDKAFPPPRRKMSLAVI